MFYNRHRAAPATIKFNNVLATPGQYLNFAEHSFKKRISLCYSKSQNFIYIVPLIHFFRTSNLGIEAKRPNPESRVKNIIAERYRCQTIQVMSYTDNICRNQFL